MSTDLDTIAAQLQAMRTHLQHLEAQLVHLHAEIETWMQRMPMTDLPHLMQTYTPPPPVEEEGT